MNFVLQFLHENRDRLDLASYGVPERLACVLLTPRFRASSHVVYLILPEGQSAPVLVAKVPRLLDSAGSLEREAENLRFAQQALIHRSASVPRLLAFEEFRGRPILVETALVGRPMDPPFVRRKLQYCCNAACDWLADLQPTLGSSELNGRGPFERLAAEPLNFLDEAVPWNRDERIRFERTRQLIEPLRDIPFPTVLEHGDFSHPNLMLLDDSSLGVVDWEMAEPHGLPVQDLVFFLTYAAFARHRTRENGETVPAIRSAFFGESAWAAPFIVAHAGRLNLLPEAIAPMFLLCWVRYLAGLLRRLDDSTTRFGEETAAWLRQNRYYHAWNYSIENVQRLCCQGVIQ